jgi:hypothetical protein
LNSDALVRVLLLGEREECSHAFPLPSSLPKREERKDLLMVTQLNPTEARQATKTPRAMLWVLIVSLMLAFIAGLALAVGWISLPWGA